MADELGAFCCALSKAGTVDMRPEFTLQAFNQWPTHWTCNPTSTPYFITVRTWCSSTDTAETRRSSPARCWRGVAPQCGGGGISRSSNRGPFCVGEKTCSL